MNTPTSPLETYLARMAAIHAKLELLQQFADEAPPAAQRAGTPRDAGISDKKKGPEIIRALVDGGAWGGRTSVVSRS